METVTVSSKYQIVIPKNVREILKLKPGDQLVLMPFQGGIELVPWKPIRELRGIAKGIDTAVLREEDRELP